MPNATGTPTGAELIATERLRQTEVEGWSSAHDDTHRKGELAMAAACFAAPEKIFAQRSVPGMIAFGDPWPWSAHWDKRTHAANLSYSSNRARRVRTLAKAGALIAAEIDRLQRMDQ